MAPPFSMSRLWHHVSIPIEVDGFVFPSPTWLPRFVHVLLHSLSLSSLYLSSPDSLSLSLSLLYISQSPDSLSRSSLYSRIHSTPRRKKLAALPYAKAAARGQTECTVYLCAIGEGDKVSELRCRHVFHRGCLDEWVDRGGDR